MPAAQVLAGRTVRKLAEPPEGSCGPVLFRTAGEFYLGRVAIPSEFSAARNVYVMYRLSLMPGPISSLFI
jgi:hypothetical protein